MPEIITYFPPETGIWCLNLGKWGSSHITMAYVLGCNIMVHKFKLWSQYYIHFRSNTLGNVKNTLIPPQLWVK